MNIINKYPQLIIFFLTFLFRILFWSIFSQNVEIGPDSHEYLGVGHNLLNGNGFWNNERGGEYYFSEPIYPLLIAFVLFLFKNVKIIIVVQSIISSFSSVVFFKIMRDLQFSKNMIFIASLILIFHPYFNYWNGLYMPESLRVFALLLVIKFALNFLKMRTTKNLVYFGLICGFSSLIRFPFGFMIPFFAMFLFIFMKSYNIKNLSIYLFASLLVLSPWYIRNYSINGSISKYTILERFSGGLKPETIYRITDQEKYYKEMGGNRGVLKSDVIDPDLRKQNRAFLLLKMTSLRLKEFYKFYPTGSDFSFFKRFSAAIFNIPIFVFGLFGLFKLCKEKRFDVFFILVIPIINLTLIHIVSNTHDSRYSLPLIPIEIILSFIFIKDFLNKRLNLV